MGLQLPNLSELRLSDLRLDISLPDLRPDLPDMSGFSNPRLPDIDLPDLPSLSALGSLAAQLQTVVSSAIAHPFWAIALILLAITLIQIVADLIKRSLKAFLTLLLKLPLFISQWIWKRATNPDKKPTDAQILSKAEQADQLIAQLEALRQEQDSVVLALKDLLSQPEPQPVLPVDSVSPSPPTLEPQPESQTPSP